MSKSLRASEEGIKQIRKAMKQGGFTQKDLAEAKAVSISRSVLTVLFRGEAISKDNFEKICDYLMLDWQDIRGEDVTNDDDNLDLLVQEVKQKIAADVTDRCGTMRVLDMTQPVDLDRIYTDVNILKDVIGRRRIGYDEVMEVCTREHFDRFLVGTIKERVTGFEAVEEFQKLVVLGKPGAGKTTFMKYLAMSCLAGKFHGELVPIFVTLKAYAEERGQPSLENYILTEFVKRKVSQDVAKRLLDEGKALILLDGLDEVKKEDDRRVKQDIDQFSRDWLKNRFAITCRIAAREYQFEKFTEVEVADFDDRQIETFVNNWFRERDESKAKRLLERLKGNQPVKELAKSPLLLTLLCLVFGERNDFPPKRSELYKEGLEVLMKKWDAKRNIEREIIYKHLSPQNKEDMLAQIAFNTFVNGEYFFRQEDLQAQIKDYICNLPEASADPEALRLDSEVVLKAIEHHHGLLVERARNIYSFSHLTFQEYFTAKSIERSQQLEVLVQNISNPRWKEVFHLTAEMLWRSNDFLRMMKECIDGMLAHDEKLQAFLEWAKQKADSAQTKYKHKDSSIRGFYAYLAMIDMQYNASLNIFNINLKKGDIYTSIKLLEYSRNINDIICSVQNFAYNLESNHTTIHFSKNLGSVSASELKIDLSFSMDIDLFMVSILCSATINLLGFPLKNNNLSNKDDLELTEYNELLNNMNDFILQIFSDNINIFSAGFGDASLIQKLKPLKKNLIKLQFDKVKLLKWLKKNGVKWISELRQVCIENCNICHDWKFTKEQVELLEQYYAANLLLVECMNRSYVSKEVREEIEATMLLPRKK